MPGRGPVRLGEDVVGQVQVALQDLAGGAYERRLRDDELVTFCVELHLHTDAALRVQHGEVVGAHRQTGMAGDRARQRECGRHPDGAGRRVRDVAAPWGEVARGDAVLAVAHADEHRFRDDLVGDVAQPHAQACDAAQRLQPGEQGGVGIELLGGLAPADVEISRPHNHQRHGGVDAGDLDAVDDVDAPPGREDRTGDRAPGIEEVQPDRGCGACHSVDARVAGVADQSAGGLHGGVDARSGVDVVDAHCGGALGGRHEALFDREGPDACQHVAAVGAGVDRSLPDADLGEQVVHVAAGPAGPGDDGHLAGQRAAAADPVEAQHVGGADGADQRLVAGPVVGGQPVAEEERAAGGACAHQHARHHPPGAGHGRVLRRSRTRSTMTPAWPR